MPKICTDNTWIKKGCQCHETLTQNVDMIGFLAGQNKKSISRNSVWLRLLIISLLLEVPIYVTRRIAKRCLHTPLTLINVTQKGTYFVSSKSAPSYLTLGSALQKPFNFHRNRIFASYVKQKKGSLFIFRHFGTTFSFIENLSKILQNQEPWTSRRRFKTLVQVFNFKRRYRSWNSSESYTF